MSESILEEADRLINGERLDTYEGTDDAIVALWSAYLGLDLTVLDYANLMILLKIARTKGQYHRDSYVDIAGYAGVGPRLWAAKNETPPAARAPRVWQSADDIPVGVKVTDKDGDVYAWLYDEWCWFDGDGTFGASTINDPDAYAPFTEVLGDGG